MPDGGGTDMDMKKIGFQRRGARRQAAGRPVGRWPVAGGRWPVVVSRQLPGIALVVCTAIGLYQEADGVQPPAISHQAGGDALAADTGLIRSSLLAPILGQDGPLFSNLSPSETGITFTAPIDLDHPRKQLFLHGFAGGGICIGDFDGDGRPDVYFAGRIGPGKLYRQTGDFRFADVTERAGVDGGGAWGAGATFVDVDNDGDLDLYVCNYDAPNLLYINRGDGTFAESAEAYGLDFRGATIMAAFADIDNDGDLDVHLVTNRIYAPIGEARTPEVIRVAGRLALEPGFEETHALQERIVNGERQQFIVQAGQRDHLYRNNGDGTFTEITESAGIAGNDPGLAATWWDYNNDRLPDLYVSNDYWAADRLYRNNGDNTFTDVIKETVPHTPWFSMGADSADVDNDGLIDFLAADMSSTTHFMQKMTMGDMGDSRWFLESAEPRQYMRNALYLNTGTARMMEVAFLTGLAKTDWTWSVKFGDLDNDGWVDAFFTNGTLNQSFNPDFAAQQAAQARFNTRMRLDAKKRDEAQWRLYKRATPRRESNLAFRNTGDLHFVRTEKEWGLDHVGISHAAAFADLDRDGDLDIIVGHLGEPVGVYRNNCTTGGRLLVRLVGTRSNRFGIGAKVRLQTASGVRVRELTLARGFMSADEPLVHFGLGRGEAMFTLTVEWPSGHTQVFREVKAGQLLTITEPSGAPPVRQAEPPAQARFRDVTDAVGLVGAHRENPFDDFRRQPLLPNRLSRLGPGLAWGDVNGDGHEDLFVGGASGQAGRLFISDGHGGFSTARAGPWHAHKDAEDMAPLFFDADGDGDADLYVASGGVACEPGDPVLRDRLYLNDGAGGFVSAPDGALPDVADSSGVVAAADFDADGDLDLFVGGRVVPGRYPITPNSRLLRNDGGRFVDVTDTAAKGLRSVGLVTGALWSDVDGDARPDLLVTIEWGPVRYWRNVGAALEDRTAFAGLEHETGWFSGITGADFDHDGDIDYVVSNVGLNSKYHASRERPALLYYGDFDGSGRTRLVEAEYEGDTLYPVRGRSCSSRAMPFIGGKFPTFTAFAKAPVDEIYSAQRLDQASVFEAVRLESIVLINDGSGRFRVTPLPILAQASPGFGIVATDFDGDTHVDLLIAQNSFSPQPETGRMDGGLSVLLTGRGDGSFSMVPPAISGIIVPGDAKALTLCDLNEDGRPDIVMSQNNGPLLAFLNTNAGSSAKTMSVRLKGTAGNPTAVGARVTLVTERGSSQMCEVYAGSGYLSQSSPLLFFGVSRSDPPRRLEVRWPDGSRSTHPIGGGESRIVIAQPGV